MKRNNKVEVHMVLPPNALSRKQMRGVKQKKYKPNFAEIMLRNAHEEYDLGENERYASEKLYALSEQLGRMNPKAQAHGCLGGEWGYGQDFKNDVFEMHPYWWGECTCGAGDESDEHKDECKLMLPNFRCGDIEISWYKYIGRGMTVSRKVSREELREMFRKCFASISQV